MSFEKKINNLIDWKSIKAVIFDLDGTLYDQSKLRRCMTKRLLIYYSMHLFRVRDIQILMSFRNIREDNKFKEGQLIKDEQYNVIAKRLNIPLKRVESVIDKWIDKVPLIYIHPFIYPGVKDFFDKLNKRNVKIIIFSDLPGEEKMKILDLPDYQFFCSNDKDINALKPDPKGLSVILAKTGFRVGECLFIGDRDERDGECARRKGMDYLIHEKKYSGKMNRFQSYFKLIDQLNKIN